LSSSRPSSLKTGGLLLRGREGREGKEIGWEERGREGRRREGRGGDRKGGEGKRKGRDGKGGRKRGDAPPLTQIPGSDHEYL